MQNKIKVLCGTQLERCSAELVGAYARRNGGYKMKEEKYYTEREIIEMVEAAMARYASSDADARVALCGHYIIRKLLENSGELF